MSWMKVMALLPLLAFEKKLQRIRTNPIVDIAKRKYKSAIDQKS